MNSLNNNKNLDINRGVELILRSKKPNNNSYLLCFEKLVFLFGKKINIYFKFSLDIGNSK
jgi:hypothetical protein